MVKTKRIIIAVITILIMALSVMPTAYAVDSYTMEQAQINKPEITVYLSADSNPHINTSDVTAYLDAERLSAEKVSWFADEQEGLTYILLVDVSTSMTGGQISAIKQSAISLINNMEQNDALVLITFGLSINVLLDGSEDKQAAQSKINEIVANQNGTMFYEALYKAIEIANNFTSNLPNRKVAFVFSDAEDVNAGGVTIDELSTELKHSCVPFYTFGFSNAGVADLDQFGQLARASGGRFVRVTEQNLSNELANVVNSLQSCVVLNLRSSNNIVDSMPTMLKISFDTNGSFISLEREVTPQRWISDPDAPVIESVEKQSERILKIKFSENVVGADNIKNYVITGKNNTAILLAEAVYSETDRIATLTTESSLLSDTLQIKCTGITDNSMERNPLTQIFTYDLKGKSPFVAGLEFFFLHYWWVVLILALIAIVLIAYLVIKKRKGVVVIEGKIGFGDNVEQQHRFELPHSTPLKLAITEVNGKTSEVILDVYKSIFVGRSDICELSFADNKLSKQHFVIEENDGDFYISDLGSTNGTFVNGVRIQSRRKLNENDTITAGQERLIYKK